MKVIILCGGMGMRMQSGQDIPKPMSLVHEKPLLYHIMCLYAKHGFHDFILPLGYKGDVIRNYFLNYEYFNCDIQKDTGNSTVTVLQDTDPLRITMVDTGQTTMTGARIKKVAKYIDTDLFMVTYGDGLSDIDLTALVDFHKNHGKLATVTGIPKKSQYGVLDIADDGLATAFSEKTTTEGIINGGFFVFDRKVLDYISDDPRTVLEEDPMQQLINDQQLVVYPHDGLWIAVDTPKDLQNANELWGNINEK